MNEVMPTNRHTVRQAYWLLNEDSGKFTDDLDEELDAWLLREKRSAQIEELVDLAAFIKSLKAMIPLKNMVLEAMELADRIDHSELATDLVLSIAKGYSDVVMTRKHQIFEEMHK